MIVRIVKMTFQENKVQDFLQLFEQIKFVIKNTEGCTYLSLLRDINDNRIFFTYSHWQAEENLENYKNSAFFREVWPATKILFSGKAEAWSLTENL